MQGSENRKLICCGLPQEKEDCVRKSGHGSKYSQPRDVGIMLAVMDLFYLREGVSVGFNYGLITFSLLVLTPLHFVKPTLTR